MIRKRVTSESFSEFMLKTDDPVKKLEYANKLIFVKEYRAAEKLIEELTEHECADNILVHLRRIELGVKLDTLEQLRTEYEQILVQDPENITARVCHVLVEQHGEFIKPEEATKVFQALLKSIGPHPAIYYGIGFSMEMEDNYERALYNYQQCIAADHTWYPGYFGMSQIYYHLGEDDKGDHFFFLFEELAPYNVYGNFETHRKLTAEFVDREQYDFAEKSIVSLSEWWMDNKGYCPIEIQVYERFATAKVAEISGDSEKAKKRRIQGEVLVKRALVDDDETEGVLYFIAKSLEEFSEHHLALKVYKRILSMETSNPEIVQKIGSQFLSMGEYEMAADLFEEAYRHHPDNPEIRFCWSVARLRLAGVNVEEYLIEKERLKNLIENQSDKVELLSLLHSLIAKYPDDPDIQGYMGDVYLRLGNEERAAKHYKRMYDQDSHSLVTKIKYISFEMQYGAADKAEGILKDIPEDKITDQGHQCEILWLKANFSFIDKNYKESLNYLNKALLHDPWNVTYLVQQVLIFSALNEDKINFNLYDSVLKKLAKNDEKDLDWKEFSEKTKLVSEANLLELTYCRSKLSFLYAEGDEDSLISLVNAACRLDASRSTYDFLKLLNTNFDSPNIYWALGKLYKELWQLEAAGVWFEQILVAPESLEPHKAKAYLELSDCYCWRGLQLDKAVEYARMALDLEHSLQRQGIRNLAHALLRRGEVRQAEVYLEELEDEDPEVVYLKGLLQYRNGATKKANEIWKPLLTLNSASLRQHTIKQEVMKYYFEKAPYKGIN